MHSFHSRRPAFFYFYQKLLAEEASVGSAGLIIVELFPRQLINIFGAANESGYYTDFAIRAFRIYFEIRKRPPY